MSRPDITVSIVSYNTADLLRVCLQTLADRRAEEEVSFEVVVADNASADGSAAMVRADFPWVRLIETGDNLGFGKGHNRALEDAQGRYFCILNSDAEIRPGVLQTFRDYLDAHPLVGAVGGQLLNPDGSPQASYGPDPTLRGVFYEQTFLGTLLGQMPWKDAPAEAFTAPTEVEQLCGACMMIRAAAYRQIDGFDPAYFMYNEDVDLNVRLRRAGWRIMFLPQVGIPHHLGASSRSDWRQRARMVAAYNASRHYYWSRFYGPFAGRQLKAYTLLGAAIRLLGWTLLSAVRPEAREKKQLFYEVWSQTRAMTTENESA